MDITTIGLAVDSSQVDTAGSALDRMVAAGDRATAATARLAKTSADSGRAMAGIAPAASKNALAFKSVADAAAALGPAAAQQLAGVSNELASVQRAANATAGSITAAGLSWRQFLGQRMGPVMGEFSAQGLPHTEAHSAAIRQISQEWKQYKDAATAAQTAVSAQSAAAGAALAATANQAAGTARALDGMASAAERTSRRGTGSAAGLTEIATEATRARVAVTDLSKATTSLGATGFVDFDKVTTSLGAAAAKASEASREVHQLRTETAQLGALASATTSLGARVGPQAPAASLREAIERRGMPTLDPRLAGGAAAANALAGAASKATGQMDALGKSTKMAAWQQQQLGFQVHDFFVQVASGGSPITALVQQGSQLSGTFGGVGNAFRAVTSLITPFRLAVGGVAAAVAALVYSFYEGEKRSKAFADSVLLSGNFAGQTEGKFNTLSRAIADGTDSSVLKVREIGQALIATGEIGPQVFAQAQAAAVGFGQATGKTAEDVAKSFAQMSRDPAKWAAEMNRQLNFVSSAQYNAIKAAQDNGRAADAQGLVYDALNQRFPKLQQNLVGLDSVLAKGQQSWVRFWEAAFAPATIEDRIAQVQARLQRLNNANEDRRFAENAGGAAFIGPSSGRASVQARQQTQAELADLQRRQFRQSENAAADAFKAVDEKRAISAIEAVKGYEDQMRGAARVNDELRKMREHFAALKGKTDPDTGRSLEVPQAKQESILADIRNKFGERGAVGGKGEAQQILRARLETDLGAIKALLDQERVAVTFHERYLQGVFQEGGVTMREFYEQKRQAIARGVESEIAELDKERARLLQYQRETKDPSEKVATQKRIDAVHDEQEKVRTAAAREIVLANQQETASFRQLADQVAQYRASLLQLQGDDAGAAKARAEHAIAQARLLARQSEGTAGAISEESLADHRRAEETVAGLVAAKNKISEINQRLQFEEDRIAFAMQRGIVGEIQGMQQLGAARAKRAAELEQEIQTLEQLAKVFPKNWQLQIDTSRAREELQRLKADLDPLKDKFDAMFRGAGANALESLMNRRPKEALKGFLSEIQRQINATVAGDLSTQVFGKSGMLGGAGEFLARVFGSKAPVDTAGATLASATPLPDTSGVTASLLSLQTAGIDPTTATFARLQLAADTAANALGRLAVSSPGGAGLAGSLFSGGGNAGGTFASDEALALFFHRGGIVGAHRDLRPAPRGVFADAGRYHGGGTVGGAGAAGLKAHEVPAILMGGPRGKREEVLTASDPRHRDNLSPRAAAAMGIPRYHSGGIAGQRPDVLLPAAGVRYLTAADAGDGDGKNARRGAESPIINNNVSVAMPQGGSRQTAQQFGAEVSRQLERARYRNGR